jgi:hypothetical protein
MKSFDELLAEAADIIERGDKHKVAQLFKENYQYREKIRSQKEVYEDQLKDLKEKVPANGMVVVKEDEFNQLKGFKEQVGDFDQIQTRLQAIERLEQDNVTLKNKWNLTRAAQQFGYNADALEPLVQGKSIVFEDEAVFIVDGDNKKELDKYVDEDLTVFVPAIKSGQGPKYPAQKLGTDNEGASTKGIVDAFIERNKPKQ